MPRPRVTSRPTSVDVSGEIRVSVVEYPEITAADRAEDVIDVDYDMQYGGGIGLGVDLNVAKNVSFDVGGSFTHIESGGSTRYYDREFDFEDDSADIWSFGVGCRLFL
ncbi:MAG: hypothetical protein JXB04_09130 [Kiritimatiellae bacterium]|nr:hypothetical protein [Kiritimatiellia bacterium]